MSGHTANSTRRLRLTEPAPARSDRPRILLVGAVPPPYHGGSVVTSLLLQSSLHERFDFRHLDISDRRGLENLGRLDGGNVRLAARHGGEFIRMLLREHVDLVYTPVAQNTLGFLRDTLFMGPAALRRIPLVLHFHNGAYAEFVRSTSAPVRALVRLLLGRARRGIVLGEALRPMLDGLMRPERVIVIPNGVPDLTRGRRVEPGDGRMRVLFLGNLIPTKGYVELLAAVQTLLDEGVDVEVTFAGSVVDAEVHRRALEDTRLRADRIRFAGAVGVEQKTALLESSDVLALPTYYENEAHPLVLLEAMAAGMAVISTRHVAIPEIVVDDVTGLLIEPRDVPQLTEALRRLAQDPPLRRRLGRAGRARYLEAFTAARWADRMGALFASVTS